jgi:hypothetical protein
VTGQTTKEGNATGEVEVVIRNNGGVGALILASELTLCYWSLPHSFLSQDDLYKSKACVTEQLFDDLSEIDSRSTWKIRHAFQRSAVKGSRVRVVQGIVFLWYARMDRLRVDTEPFVDIPRASQLTSITVDSRACRDWTLSVHRVEEESRFQGIVQRDRRLVYLRDPDAPVMLTLHLLPRVSLCAIMTMRASQICLDGRAITSRNASDLPPCG